MIQDPTLRGPHNFKFFTTKTHHTYRKLSDGKGIYKQVGRSTRGSCRLNGVKLIACTINFSLLKKSFLFPSTPLNPLATWSGTITHPSDEGVGSLRVESRLNLAVLGSTSQSCKGPKWRFEKRPTRGFYHLCLINHIEFVLSVVN